MRTCIYDYISKIKCIKCMILMHEIACYQYLKGTEEMSNQKVEMLWDRNGEILREVNVSVMSKVEEISVENWQRD